MNACLPQFSRPGEPLANPVAPTLHCANFGFLFRSRAR